MNLAQFTEPNLVAFPLLSDWRNDAIRELSYLLHQAGRIKDTTSFSNAVLQDESFGSVVFDRIAFSFGYSRTVKTLSFALGIAPRGVAWNLDGSPPVYVVVLFATLLSQEERYLSLLRAFSQLYKDKKAITALCRCTKPEEIYAILGLTSCACD
jgi:mannitol/fructose-specific phosphotransferase system IIA component (Ntr-type)